MRPDRHADGPMEAVLTDLRQYASAKADAQARVERYLLDLGRPLTASQAEWIAERLGRTAAGWSAGGARVFSWLPAAKISHAAYIRTLHAFDPPN